MKCTALSLRTVCFLVVVLGLVHSIQALELSGRCYSGTKPDPSTELQGVDLTLYGAASAGGARDQLDTYTTGSSQPNGWYKLTIVEGYEHYFIEASTPSGYTFDDASSVDGTVSGNEIHYSTESAPLENQTLTGNKFWFIPDTPDNNPPVADADGPYMGQLSQTITLDGSGSYDPDPGDSIVSYEWDLDNNGHYNDATGVNPTWLWNSVGTHTIGLRVTDQSGETDTDTSKVTIEEGEPETGVLEGYKRDADTGQGLAGWRIYIDLNGNGQWDGSEPSAETDGSGFYRIPDVEPGTYRVCEVMQPGWQSDAPCVDGVSIVADTTTTQDFHNRREGGGEEEYDFGDAPDPTYPTILAQNGARHTIDPDVFLGMRIDGESNGQPTANAEGDDNDGMDDEDGVVFTSTLTPGTTASVTVTASVPGLLYGWIDFDRNGNFEMPRDYVFSGQLLSAGPNVLGMAIPADAAPGLTFARFRFSRDSVLDPEGPAPNGEVEDYQVEIVDGGGTDKATVGDRVWHDLNRNGLQDAGEPGLAGVTVDLFDAAGHPVTVSTTTDASGFYQFTNLFPAQYSLRFTAPAGYTFSPMDQGTDDTIDSDVNPATDDTPLFSLSAGEHNTTMDAGLYEGEGQSDTDFGDAPSSYPSTVAQNGARHVPGGPWLGVLPPDTESDAWVSPYADGDDINGNNDEDGVMFMTALIPGQFTWLGLNFSGPGQDLTYAVWIDYDGNGNWEHPAELYSSDSVKNLPSLPLGIVIANQIPAHAKPGTTYVRCRVYQGENVPVSPTGSAMGGEVEDFEIEIQPDGIVEKPDHILTGIKFNDLDGDGVWDPGDGELGLPNWKIWLDTNNDGLSDKTVVTDSQGYFDFPGIQPGTYTVGETLQAGWTQTAPGAPGSYTVTVPNSQHPTIHYMMFGNTQRDIVTGEDDFGDAPDSYGTLKVSGGPWHNLGNVYLGSLIDPEPDGLPGVSADRDDNTTVDDEDGVSFIVPMKVGASASVQVVVTTPNIANAAVAGWVDFDHSGTFDDPAERVVSRTYAGMAGGAPFPHTENFQVPATAKGGDTYMRFRVYRTEPGIVVLPSPKGSGGEGEVEDYKVYILSDGPGPDDYDFGDAPDSYGTLHASGGAYHLAQPGIFFGNSVDSEVDGQLVPAGLGDDNDGNDDEDGTSFLGDLVPGQKAWVSRTILNPPAGAKLSTAVWIDYNQDGVFQNPSERIVSGPWGGFFQVFAEQFQVPASAKVGKTYARFRVFESKPGLVISPTGYGGVGEVEDHAVEIKRDGKVIPPGVLFGGLKWNDSNGNGAVDPGESGLGGWTIWIDLNGNGIKDAGESTLTNPDGSFYFAGLNPGTYTVYEDMQPGWKQTYPGGAGTHTITIKSGQLPPVIRFGNRREDDAILDFGDAPDSYGTLLASTGAMHQASSLTLGPAIDTEMNGLPSIDAQGDDKDANDDEDGVVSLGDLTLTAGQPDHITLRLDNNDPVALDSGSLVGWIDFNGDGQFQDTTENIGIQHVTVPGASQVHINLSFPVPLNAKTGTSYARFRLYRDDPNPLAIPILLSPTGDGGYGEVEDYTVTIESGPTPDDRDYGDAPMPYPSASHQVGGPWLGGAGDLPDVETGMKRHPQALGDDSDAAGDDENGLAWANLVHGSASLSFMIVSFSPGGSGDVTLAAWLDWNADGDWHDSGETLGSWSMSLGPLPPGGFAVAIPATVPAGAAIGDTLLRLRIYEGLNPVVKEFGAAGAGEIEDYLVEIKDGGDPKPPDHTIIGFKFHDLDGNGAWDGMFEPFIPGWPIWLDRNGNGIQDSSDPVTVTDGSGMFQFTGLPAGTYTLGEEILPGWIQTSPAAPGLETITIPTPKGQLQKMILFGNIPSDGSGGPGEEPPHLKWSQPVLEIDPTTDPNVPPVFCAWENSTRSIQQSGEKRTWNIIVDDFHCLGPIPVTRVRWWGGYKGWSKPAAPEHQPESWHIGFWAYEEDDQNQGELFPERLMWEVHVPNERVHRTHVGKTDYPNRIARSAFRYELALEPEEWFHQADFPARAERFWISIVAVYPAGGSLSNLWGWLSRPEPWGDVPQQLGIFGDWPSQEQRMFPGRINPIKNIPICSDDPRDSAHDLAFELFTEQPWIHWDQPFVGLRHWPWANDELSMVVHPPDQEPLTLGLAADDWLAERPHPVVALAWNGSYLGYGYEACDCQQLMGPVPRRPDAFFITIREHDPVAELPSQILWEFEARDFDEVQVGTDQHPEGDPNEAVFRYTVRLPEHHWFIPASPGQPYWLTVEALYEVPEDEILYHWGWTTREHVFGAPAQILNTQDESPSWNPVTHPKAGPVDLCLTVYTTE